MGDGASAQIIVVGNEKGGSGKSTTVMHLTVGLLQFGHTVATVDLDTRQHTLTRFLENRRAYGEAHRLDLRMPEHHAPVPSANEQRSAAAEEDERGLLDLLSSLRPRFDTVIVDTPGSDSVLNRAAHAAADTLITPMNDSMVDLDVLARIRPGEDAPLSGPPSHYAEMVWEQKLKRAQQRRRVLNWLVMRNRLSSLDAVNKREVERLLTGLAKRFGFQVVPGFGERVVFRELFHRGLTMMDPRGSDMNGYLNMSQVAARQEVRNLVATVQSLGSPTVREAV